MTPVTAGKAEERAAQQAGSRKAEDHTIRRRKTPRKKDAKAWKKAALRAGYLRKAAFVRGRILSERPVNRLIVDHSGKVFM